MKLFVEEGKKEVAAATDGDIEVAIRAMQEDMADFVRLVDSRFGEIRVTGPHGGSYLLQCDMQKAGKAFAGEMDGATVDEALALFRKFRAQDLSVIEAFYDREPPLPKWLVLAAIATAGIFGYMFWRAS